MEKDLGVVGKGNVEALQRSARDCRACESGRVEAAYFDRGGFLFHGRVKALPTQRVKVV